MKVDYSKLRTEQGKPLSREEIKKLKKINRVIRKNPREEETLLEWAERVIYTTTEHEE